MVLEINQKPETEETGPRKQGTQIASALPCLLLVKFMQQVQT